MAVPMRRGDGVLDEAGRLSSRDPAALDARSILSPRSLDGTHPAPSLVVDQPPAGAALDTFAAPPAGEAAVIAAAFASCRTDTGGLVAVRADARRVPQPGFPILGGREEPEVAHPLVHRHLGEVLVTAELAAGHAAVAGEGRLQAE